MADYGALLFNYGLVLVLDCEVCEMPETVHPTNANKVDLW